MKRSLMRFQFRPEVISREEECSYGSGGVGVGRWTAAEGATTPPRLHREGAAAY